MTDLISKADAIEAVCKAVCEDDVSIFQECDQIKYCDEIQALLALPSAEATKKKAELKENGDWDCPDVYCDECDHHRSVEWCSLAIPNHEEIDDTYKMVNEAFFEGFNVAEKHYRLLIETVEELDKKSAEAKPTVIRSKTLLPTKDFKEWAKRVREVNPNAVVIPCDAEVVSADAVQGFRGGKIPPNEMLNGTVLIPKHQWLEMERELAELKEKFESAEAVQGEWIRLIEYVPESNESLINFDGYQCSVCGGKLWADSFNFWNYCPICGARMCREDGEA